MMSRFPHEYSTWRIDNFFLLSKDEAFSVNLRPFAAAGATWCLRLYPYKRKSNNNYCVKLYFVRVGSPSIEHSFLCFIGLKNYRDEIFYHSYKTLHNVDIVDQGVAELDTIDHDHVTENHLSEDCVLNGKLQLYFLMFDMTYKRKESVLFLERQNVVPVDEFHISGLPFERFGCCRWQIDNIFSLPEAEDFSLDSPSFAAAGTTWCLRLYPNETILNPNNNSGYRHCVDLYLVRLEPPFPEHSLFYFVELKNYKDEIFTRSFYKITCKEAARLNYTRDIRETLLSENRVEGGKITLYFLMCSLTGTERKEIVLPSEGENVVPVEGIERKENVLPPKRENLVPVEGTERKGSVLSSESENFVPVEGVEKLSRDFKNVLLSETDSDVTIKIEGREFPAHKVIIGARSPVLAAMLRSEMKEKATGVVDIKDLDPDVFPDFLAFLYTGHKDELTVKNVFGLYKAADMYDVGELKSSCVQFMKQSLSVETFSSVVSISLLHDIKELLQEAITYFSEHVIEILETVEWQRFLKENPTQGNELLIKAFKKTNPL